MIQMLYFRAVIACQSRRDLIGQLKACSALSTLHRVEYHGVSILPIMRCCFAMLRVGGLSRSSWATKFLSPPDHSIPSNLIPLAAGNPSITLSVLRTKNPSGHVQPPENSNDVSAMLLKYSNECTTTYAHVGELPKA